MQISRGKVQNYPGMELDYSVPGESSVRMDKYVADTIGKFPEDITALVVIPAVYHLLNVSTKTTQLNETEVRDFHRATKSLIFLCKILRPDVHTAVEFLITIAKDRMDEDWKNMVRVLEYLKGTAEECLELSMEDTKLIKW